MTNNIVNRVLNGAPKILSKVSILLSIFICSYSKFFWEHMLEKKNQDGIPFQVLAPLLSHIMQELLCPIASLDLTPIIMFVKV